MTSIGFQGPRINVFNGQRIPLDCYHKDSVVTEFLTPGFASDMLAIRGVSDKNGQMEDARVVLSKSEKVLSGWHCELQPVVSPDRKSVRLTVNLEHFAKDETKAIDRVTKAARVFVLADENTLVWDLGETVERQHLFVVITPRIRVQPQEERIFMGELERIPGR